MNTLYQKTQQLHWHYLHLLILKKTLIMKKEITRIPSPASMCKVILIIILTLFYYPGRSQTGSFVLHSVIGEEISRTEKRMYRLFPELPDSNFSFARIELEQGRFYLYAYSPSDSSKRQMDSTEVKRYQKQTKRMARYYINEAREDSINQAILRPGATHKPREGKWGQALIGVGHEILKGNGAKNGW